MQKATHMAIIDLMREKHVCEMQRLSEAIQKTKSEHLKTDYTKAYRRMYRELKEYDEWHRKQNV